MPKTRLTTAVCASLVSLLAVPLVLVGSAALALTSSWANWSPVTGTSNNFALRVQPMSPGFPAATVASNSRGNVQVASGTSTFLGTATPPGAKYGSSAGSPYLVLRPRADNATAPSTTTYTFDDPTPETGWALVLGDIDSDQVQVRALDAAGAPVPAARIDTWFKGSFNYAAGGTDVPRWMPGTSTLTGNTGAVDTDGAAGWFEPDLRLSSLSLVFTRRAGFPVYQTWFVTRARPLGGTVASSSPTTCPVQSTTLTLLSPDGKQLATTQPDTTGAFSFGEWATQAGYTVRFSPAAATPPTPSSCSILGPAERTVDNRGNDGAAASRADFNMRQVIPQPISGRVLDDAGAPAPGVGVTLTRPDTTTVTRTTGPDGRYLFDDNPVANGYTVALAVPPGYVAGPGGTTRGPIDVATSPITDQDFAITSLPSVSGQVTGGGSGLGSVPVTLTPAGGAAATTTVTRGDGTYLFPFVPPGPVTISAAPPAGYTAPAPLTPTVAASDLTGQDIVLTRPGAIAGSIVDAGGAGVQGVTVTITGPAAPVSLQTDAAGSFFLDQLPAGVYAVTPTAPPGSNLTTPAVRGATITSAGELRGGLDFVLTGAPAPTPALTTAPSPAPSTAVAPAAPSEPTSSPSAQSSAATSTPATGTGASGAGVLPDTGGLSPTIPVLGGALMLGGMVLIAHGLRRRTTL